MDVKTLIVRESTNLFEKRCKEFLEKGYKMQSSTIEIDRRIPFNNADRIAELGKSPITFYYYAIFIKE